MWSLLLVPILILHVNSQCVIEYECAECLPEHMPIITTHESKNETLIIPDGEELTLTCHEGKFAAFPESSTLIVRCDAGRYQVGDRKGSSLPLLHLGCQESVLEDVLHQVPSCAPPSQGRAYLYRSMHVAHVCYDADRAVTLHARMTAATHNDIPTPPHEHRAALLTILGNFNQMFDSKTRAEAEKLFANDKRLTARIHHLLPRGFELATQSLSTAQLLSGSYFESANMPIARMMSNRVPVWSGVSSGNWKHLQFDVTRAIRADPQLEVWAGTYGVWYWKNGDTKIPLYLQAGERFPVPRFLWTIVADKGRGQAVALVTLNDPFVPVSEIRESVFCTSKCSQVEWLQRLLWARSYERPVYGLVFCCDVHSFSGVVSEAPRQLLTQVPATDNGLLTRLPSLPGIRQ